MEPYRGFVGRKVIKVKGRGKDQKGLIVDVNLLSGTWQVLSDTTQLTETVDPHEFEYELDKKTKWKGARTIIAPLKILSPKFAKYSNSV